jgi:hypothetical protein
MAKASPGVVPIPTANGIPQNTLAADADVAQEGSPEGSQTAESEFLTGTKLHLVSTAFGIANVMVALDSSILGKFPLHHCRSSFMAT